MDNGGKDYKSRLAEWAAAGYDVSSLEGRWFHKRFALMSVPCPRCGIFNPGQRMNCGACGEALHSDAKGTIPATPKVSVMPSVPMSVRRTATPQVTPPANLWAMLAPGETILARFELEGCTVFASRIRLFLLRGQTITDFDYRHISSLRYRSERHFGLVVFGVILGVVGLALAFVFLPIALLTLLGILLIIIGAGSKTEWLDVTVVGVANPIQFKGNRQNLDSLLAIMRQNRTG